MLSASFRLFCWRMCQSIVILSASVRLFSRCMCWSYCQPLFGCSVSVCASQAVCTCAILSACVVFMPLGCSVRVCAGSGVCLRSGCPVSVCSSLLAYVVVMLSASAMVVLSAMFCPPLLVLSCRRLCLSLCPFLVGLSYVLFFLSGAPGSPPSLPL